MKQTRKFKLLISIILILISFLLISWNLTNVNQEKEIYIINKDQPIYQTDNAITYVYNPMGKLAYRLVIDKICYYSKNKISWFTNPILTTYNTNYSPTWNIRANKAKLINNNILYLYGNVRVNGISPYLQQIFTESALINLITQEVLSNDKVTIIGIGVRSTGMKMRGNLRNHTAELIENIKTYYEIPNKQTSLKMKLVK